MAFKNKLKKKRIVKFSSIKKNTLIDPTKLFLKSNSPARLNTFFLNRLNLLRMLKVAFCQPLTKSLTRPNKFSTFMFLSSLETRINNTLYNSGLFLSRFEIKQLINKRKLFINGRKIWSTNIQMLPQDILTVDKSVWRSCKRNILKNPSTFFLQSRYFEINYNIFTLIVLYKKLDNESLIFLSNKLSKINFRYFK